MLRRLWARVTLSLISIRLLVPTIARTFDALGQPKLQIYFLAVRSAISLAISSLVFPSVSMPKFFPATMRGSVLV